MTINITDEFLENFRQEIYNEIELWNPKLLLDDKWEKNIPLGAGVMVQVYALKGQEGYDINMLMSTIGDETYEFAVVREFATETFEELFPVFGVNYMSELSGTPITVTVRYDDLEEATDQVEVYTEYSEEPITVNVPRETSEKRTYAKDVVKRVANKNIKRLLSEISKNQYYEMGLTAELVTDVEGGSEV